MDELPTVDVNKLSKTIDAYEREINGTVRIHVLGEDSKSEPETWPEEFLVLPLNIDSHENYILMRNFIDDGQKQIVKYSLVTSEVYQTSDRVFEFHSKGREAFAVYTRDAEDSNSWVETLQTVISVANERENALVCLDDSDNSESEAECTELFSGEQPLADVMVRSVAPQSAENDSLLTENAPEVTEPKMVAEEEEQNGIPESESGDIQQSEDSSKNNSNGHKNNNHVHFNDVCAVVEVPSDQLTPQDDQADDTGGRKEGGDGGNDEEEMVDSDGDTPPIHPDTHHPHKSASSGAADEKGEVQNDEGDEEDESRVKEEAVDETDKVADVLVSEYVAVVEGEFHTVTEGEDEVPAHIADERTQLKEFPMLGYATTAVKEIAGNARASLNTFISFLVVLGLNIVRIAAKLSKTVFWRAPVAATKKAVKGTGFAAGLTICTPLAALVLAELYAVLVVCLAVVLLHSSITVLFRILHLLQPHVAHLRDSLGHAWHSQTAENLKNCFAEGCTWTSFAVADLTAGLRHCCSHNHSKEAAADKTKEVTESTANEEELRRKDCCAESAPLPSPPQLQGARTGSNDWTVL